MTKIGCKSALTSVLFVQQQEKINEFNLSKITHLYTCRTCQPDLKRRVPFSGFTRLGKLLLECLHFKIEAFFKIISR